MSSKSAYLLTTMVIGCLLVPKTAAADLFVVPWMGGNAGGPNGSGLVDLGASVGATAAGVVDIDVDLGYSPDYFEGGSRSYVLTMMSDVTFGIPFGRHDAPRLRPYVLGGLGLMRSRFESGSASYRIGHDDWGAALGAGFTLWAAARVGVRADLRHVQTLPERLQYWRASVGVVIR